ncbi:MAG: class IV adenylate cyclase [Methanocellales archaeon]|nr:class IV adenylate cyclase [Methanocellales archaeon]
MCLGFKEVATVVKRRRRYQLNDINISIDDVRDLGTYMEVEAMVSCEEYQPLLKRIFETLHKLGLSKEDTIRESYLELILRR